MSSGEPPLSVPIDGEIDEASVAAGVRRLVPSLGDFIQQQRWYGEKSRAAASWTVAEVAPVRAGADWFALTIIAPDVKETAGRTWYFLPLAIVPPTSASSPVLASLQTAAGPRHVVDALTAAPFARWWLDQATAGAGMAGEQGTFLWQSLPGLAERLPAAQAGPISTGTAEQSNSSVRFDDAIFLKVFRRLRAGINPDEEVGRFLATRTPFRRLPIPLATAAYSANGGSTYPLTLAQTFVASVGDGWKYTLASLHRAVDETCLVPASGLYEPQQLVPAYNEAARLLGERTGELHLALSVDAGDLAFTPEPITASDAEGWEESVVTRLRATAADLNARASDLSSSLRRRVAKFSQRVPELERRAAGFRVQVSGLKTRVHGDYHLGQTMRTPDDDWVILDFEGEPARSIAERRAKTSPLKDVAGMLRSFGYARGAALRAAGERGRSPEVERFLWRWESATRIAFLAGYRSVARQRSGLVPEGASFDAATAAWELDKALYEIGYELGNRPDWLDLPLDALLLGGTSVTPPAS